ncbi:MAG: glycerophosphodiester phosphodiesterase [Jatrophihabitans sp.]|nr:MAG: glycerophosphodiester phosphodiesterase [Jatrophihabitans sp.]
MPRRPPRAPWTPPERPLVVAHRGASQDAAEHTLAAYVAAIEAGADGLECDVRLTRDGHLVCVHDRTVNRTSDGRGVVSEFDLAQLESLDFSSWHGELPASADLLVSDSPYLAGVAPDRQSSGGRVLTLEHLLDLVADTARPLRLLIETKHPTRYGGLVEKTLVETLDRYGWAGPAGPPATLHEPVDAANPVVVMSFAPTALRRVKLLAPQVPTALLLERLVPRLPRGLLPAGVPIAGPGIALLRAEPALVARLHQRGYGVYAWTVDEPADVDLALGLGVDAVITNRPASVLARIGGKDGPQRPPGG